MCDDDDDYDAGFSPSNYGLPYRLQVHHPSILFCPSNLQCTYHLNSTLPSFAYDREVRAYLTPGVGGVKSVADTRSAHYPSHVLLYLTYVHHPWQDAATEKLKRNNLHSGLGSNPKRPKSLI